MHQIMNKMQPIMNRIVKTSPPARQRPASIPPNSQQTSLITSHSSGIATARISKIKKEMKTNFSNSPMAVSVK